MLGNLSPEIFLHQQLAPSVGIEQKAVEDIERPWTLLSSLSRR